MCHPPSLPSSQPEGASAQVVWTWRKMAESLLTRGSALVLLLLLATANSSCPPGKFGWECRLQCYCKSGTCDPDTGVCPSGCAEGKYGDSCHLDSKCIYEPQGTAYTGSLGVTASGEKCQPWTKRPGLFPSQFPDGRVPGAVCRNPSFKSSLHYTLPWCYSEKGMEMCNLTKCECPAGLYGDSCRKVCHCRDPTEISCSLNDGVCKTGCAPGWQDRSCDKECGWGTYGDNCMKTCDNCLNKACHHVTGVCLKGCVAGFSGKFCKTGCKPGKYGQDCAHTCGQCKRGAPCNPATGNCFDGCDPGWVSKFCDEPCKPGKFGPACLQYCGNCADYAACDRTDGRCPGSCLPGWKGQLCDKQCEEGRYGNDCNRTCGHCNNNATCHPSSGLCPNGCQDGFQGAHCMQAIVMPAKSSVLHAAIAGVCASVFLIIIIAIIICWRKRRHNKMNLSRKSTEDFVPELPEHNETCQLLGDSRVESLVPEDVVLTEINEPIYVNVTQNQQTSPVKLSELYDYIKKNKESNCYGFKKEFSELPVGLLALCEVARKQENREKNRYNNIIAYDHSRVVLEPLQNEPYSDYVNANYMDGYSRKRAYIASQGPNKTMIRDFWRMVWQQKVCKIVMLTNLMEAVKRKCEQYWPKEGSVKYGEVTVKLVNTATYTDFVIRTMEISKDEISRIVKQFHFTSWSDHGAPTYPTTLLAFRRKVQTYNPESIAPILCHCSAGIGRTGTYIALDYLLEQAQREGQVDVLGIAQVMRTNRVNMIQTWEQYVFVYEALLEAIKAGDTTIPRSAFRSVYQSMCCPRQESNPTPLEEQYQVLQLLSPTMDKEEFSQARLPENMPKNRCKNVLPANRCRPFLYTPVEDCNDYINAVFLPGYTQKERLLVTQMPLPNTVADFWRMIYDYNSDTVVMLNEFDRNDPTCALYWPEEYGYAEEHGQLTVELLSSSEADPDVTTRIFKLCNLKKGEERAVKQLLFKSWPDLQSVPNSTTCLLRLHRQMAEWMKQNGKGPITIHCMNGASKSGLFAAICLIFERLELDVEVDVYQAVKQIRMNRPQFIENFEQYQFCYQAVMEYLDGQE